MLDSNPQTTVRRGGAGMSGGRRGVGFLGNWNQSEKVILDEGLTHNRVPKYPNTLKAPQDRKTEIQLVANAL
jgi:hypothetical protein